MPEDEDIHMVFLIKVMKTKVNGKDAMQKIWYVCGRICGLLYFLCISIPAEVESTNSRLSHIMHTKLHHDFVENFLLPGC